MHKLDYLLFNTWMKHEGRQKRACVEQGSRIAKSVLSCRTAPNGNIDTKVATEKRGVRENEGKRNGTEVIIMSLFSIP